MRTLARLMFTLLICASPASAAVDKPVLGKTAAGKVALQGIDVLRFAPQGVLLIGDGKGGQIVAVDTGDKTPLPGAGARIEDLNAVIAGKLGAKAADIEITAMAVNPLSHRAYLAVKKHDTRGDVIITIDPAGKIDFLALNAVKHVKLAMPKSGSEAVRLNDVAWAGDRLVVSARSNEQFASKLLVIPGPLSDGASAALASAETYHIAHGKWETKAPMSSLMPYEENGRMYIVGAFSCTPIVKYPVEDIRAGAQLKGLSMLELGSGNKPINMFTYDKDGKASVMVNTFRFHHQRAPLSPSPYWTCRFDRDILAENEKVNEKGTRRDVKNPSDPRITMADNFHRVKLMGRLDDKNVLAIREADDKKLTLEVIGLP